MNMISSQMAYAISYLEINIISVVLIAIVKYKTKGLSKMVAQRNFAMSIHALMWFFLSDTFYVMMKCGILPYNRIAVMVTKEIYFFSTTLMCFFWFVYFEYIQDSPFVKSIRRIRIASVLVWIMGLLLIVNCFTGILFYVDSNNVYCRGPLFVLQYVLSYIYVVITCMRALFGIFQKEKYAMRGTLILLAIFPVAPALAGVIQFIYPQLPLACATLSLATLVLYLNWTDQIISIDPLTKLSNRKHLLYNYEQWSHLTNQKTNL